MNRITNIRGLFTSTTPQRKIGNSRRGFLNKCLAGLATYATGFVLSKEAKADYGECWWQCYGCDPEVYENQEYYCAMYAGTCTVPMMGISSHVYSIWAAPNGGAPGFCCISIPPPEYYVCNVCDSYQEPQMC